jgi:hypothetical protein
VKPPPKALQHGACVGKPARIFDATTIDDATEALWLCSKCWVKRECLAWMQPGRRFYDGVVGGKLWHDGKEIQLYDLRAYLHGRMR